MASTLQDAYSYRLGSKLQQKKTVFRISQKMQEINSISKMLQVLFSLSSLIMKNKMQF